MYTAKRAIYVAFALLMVLQFASAQSPVLSDEVVFVTNFMQRNILASFPDGWDFENVGSMCSGDWTGIECADFGTNTRIIALYVQMSSPSVEKEFQPSMALLSRLAN